MPDRSYPEIPDGLPAPTRPISFVCVEFCDEYKHNILTSDCVKDPMNQFIHVDNRQNMFFNTLGAAICHGVAQAKHDLVAVVHEDVVLPKNWQARFEASLRELEAEDPDWALLGAVGWPKPRDIQGHWSDPRKLLNTFGKQNFIPVARLDEQLLIFRRSGHLKFDPLLPSIHNIGRDLPNTALKLGQKTYAVNAPTIHKYADTTGKLVQSPKDSPKIKGRKSRTYLADRACSDDYFAHKWGNYSDDDTRDQQASEEHLRSLEQPVILVGRGGGGTRLLSTIAQDCGLFIGNDVSKSGDTMEMVHEIYATLFRQEQYCDPWLQSLNTIRLRSAAHDMLGAAGWPPMWGFKLPETLLILPEILRAFPGARFVSFSRDPKATSMRRTHMTARLDNHVGRTSLRLAYEHFGIPLERILEDDDYTRMVVTTLHQVALAKAHLHPLGPERLLQLGFEDTLQDPGAVLQRFSKFTGLPVVTREIEAQVDPERAHRRTAQMDHEAIARAEELLARLAT